MYSLLSFMASLALQPAAWVLALVAVIALRKPSPGQRRLAWAALALAALFTNPWLHHAVSNWWEPEPVALADLDPPFDAAIVLGGFTRLHATPADRLHLNAEANRFTHALELYRAGKARRLVFVSGGVTSSLPRQSEAELARSAAERLGLPPADLVALSTSRNTRENATETRDYLDREAAAAPRDGASPPRLLLVTSAFHARRAEACFRREGLEVTLFPTDHRSERDHPDRKLGFANTLLPSPATILSWGPLFREWAGYLSYRVRRWI